MAVTDIRAATLEIILAVLAVSVAVVLALHPAVVAVVLHMAQPDFPAALVEHSCIIKLTHL